MKFLILIFLLAACDSGDKVWADIESYESKNLLEGNWALTNANCDNSQLDLTGESNELLVQGKMATINSSFDNGQGGLCTVQTPATLVYLENQTASMTYKSSACSPECPPLTCVSTPGKAGEVMLFSYEVGGAVLKIMTEKGKRLGCSNNKKLILDWIRK